MKLVLILLLPVLCAASVISFLQITDIHYDPDYNGFENPSTDCNGPANEGIERPYGQYGCDSPSLLIEMMIESILELPETPAFIAMTGDNVGHNVDTEDATLSAFSLPITLLSKSLPNTPIYQVIGNNDLYPKNTMQETNSEYLGKLESTLKNLVNFPEPVWLSFAQGGYYSHSPIPGLRMIVLNTIFYFTDISPPLTNQEDPAGQFSFLGRALKLAELDRQKVIISCHMGVGGSRQSNLIWKSKYVKDFLNALEPYEDIIIAVLEGHSHRDIFNMMYPIGLGADNVTHHSPATAPFAVALNSASLAPGAYNKPSYRVYYLDTDSMKLVDYKQMVFDFTTLQWSQYYSFQKMTGENPNPKGFLSLYQRLQGASWPPGPSTKSICNYISSIWASNSLFIWQNPSEYVSDCWALYCSITQLTKDQLDNCVQNPPTDLDVCYDTKECASPIDPSSSMYIDLVEAQ